MSTRFVAARSLEEAFEALAGEDALAVAGGVSVGLLANLGLISAATLVSVSRIPELRGVRAGDDGLVVGAATAHGRLAADPVLRRERPGLAEMFGHIGNVRVRAWGTVGGNLALAEPAQDPPVLLAALDAEVELAGTGGTRRVPVAELGDGPMSTVLGPGELITKVVVPPPVAGERCAYRKFLPKTADDYATVSAAVRVRFDGARIAAARVFCGAVGPVPVACETAAARLVGRTRDELRDLGDVVSAVRDAVSPRGDHRGSADYKREMAGVFVKRALAEIGTGGAA
ncbi:CO/xanthine dehydrogenase FAD-binding subunit [Amycolatopsis lexingtonensis]|uniref:CO/xanthine dehydrogenase FAD-binding subunit n=1 Tax=Amycolatopsis lexingtonensis TaxID=218822 RepID=A0ABR9HT78_9PSEU|nr:FAD binding domain-containing protein [Amycolatopsis lexingtonensis]MBE1494127.1 CO/xanthine dehydrogenase FAD-binding subunit [Amycolatopsis lexingtonensis]